LTVKLLKSIITTIVNKRSYDTRIIRNAIMDDKEIQATIIKRLNTLISLTLELVSSDKSTSIAEKVQHLLNLGLTPAEVGEILGKPTNYITAVIHRKKKIKKKKE